MGSRGSARGERKRGEDERKGERKGEHQRQLRMGERVGERGEWRGWEESGGTEQGKLGNRKRDAGEMREEGDEWGLVVPRPHPHWEHGQLARALYLHGQAAVLPKDASPRKTRAATAGAWAGGQNRRGPSPLSACLSGPIPLYSPRSCRIAGPSRCTDRVFAGASVGFLPQTWSHRKTRVI